MRDIVKSLRTVARSFELEKVTNAQAKSIIPILIQATSEIESLREKLNRLEVKE